MNEQNAPTPSPPAPGSASDKIELTELETKCLKVGLVVGVILGIVIGFAIGKFVEQSKYVTTPFGDIVPRSEVHQIPTAR